MVSHPSWRFPHLHSPDDAPYAPPDFAPPKTPWLFPRGEQLAEHFLVTRQGGCCRNSTSSKLEYAGPDLSLDGRAIRGPLGPKPLYHPVKAADADPEKSVLAETNDDALLETMRRDRMSASARRGSCPDAFLQSITDLSPAEMPVHWQRLWPPKGNLLFRRGFSRNLESSLKDPRCARKPGAPRIAYVPQDAVHSVGPSDRTHGPLPLRLTGGGRSLRPAATLGVHFLRWLRWAIPLTVESSLATLMRSSFFFPDFAIETYPDSWAGREGYRAAWG